MQTAIDKYFDRKGDLNSPGFQVFKENYRECPCCDKRYYKVIYNNSSNISKLHNVIIKHKKPLETNCDGEYYQYIGKYYYLENKLDLAIKFFKLSLKCGNNQVLLALAKCYKCKNDLDTMEELLQEALFKGIYDAAIILGNYYLYALEDIDSATHYFSLAHEHGDPFGLMSLIEFYVENGDKENAIKYATIVNNGSHNKEIDIKSILEQFDE